MSDTLHQPDPPPSRSDEAQGPAAADASASGDDQTSKAADFSSINTQGKAFTMGNNTTNNSGGVNIQGGQVGSIMKDPVVNTFRGPLYK